MFDLKSFFLAALFLGSAFSVFSQEAPIRFSSSLLQVDGGEETEQVSFTLDDSARQVARRPSSVSVANTVSVAHLSNVDDVQLSKSDEVSSAEDVSAKVSGKSPDKAVKKDAGKVVGKEKDASRVAGPIFVPEPKAGKGAVAVSAASAVGIPSGVGLEDVGILVPAKFSGGGGDNSSSAAEISRGVEGSETFTGVSYFTEAEVSALLSSASAGRAAASDPQAAFLPPVVAPTW